VKFKVNHNPIFCLEIENFFSPEANKKILEEAVKFESAFADGVVGGGKNKEMRDNRVAFYDNIFQNRGTCILLKEIEKKFTNTKLREVLASCPYPLTDFLMTNTHETQVSRYGDKKQKYKWHIDRFANTSRHISMVYWFCKEGIKIEGGELGLTSSPINDGKLIEDGHAEILKIPYKNNKAMFFASFTPHCVFPTTTLKKFDEGRFSANVWIGYR